MSLLNKAMIAVLIGSGTLIMTGCQTLSSSTATPNTNSELISDSQSQLPELLQTFNIRGKIGVTIPQTETTSAQTGSAFYVWAQEDDRFAIDLTGAMGIGHTVIEYNGATATLVSQSTGEITASSPEALLQQATGWQAPISQLRYWISGRPAPSDSNSQLDALGRLAQSDNAGWSASFSYKDNTEQSRIPTKIKVVRDDGYRVIMTINHT